MAWAADAMTGLIWFAILAMAWLIWEMAATMRELRSELRAISTLLHEVTRDPQYPVDNGGRVVATCRAAVNAGGFPG